MMTEEFDDVASSMMWQNSGDDVAFSLMWQYSI